MSRVRGRRTFEVIESRENMLRKLRIKSGDLIAKERKVGRHATMVAIPLSSILQNNKMEVSTISISCLIKLCVGKFLLSGSDERSGPLANIS